MISMQRERPTTVLVLAIFNFVLGGMGVMSMLCLGGMGALFLAMANVTPPPGQPNPMKEVWGMYEAIPGFIPYTIATTLLGVVLAVLLIIAGFGLLRMQTWARTICIAYAIIAILMGGVGLVYQLTTANPAMATWQMENARKKGIPVATPPVFADIMAVGGTLLGAIYPVTLLIVLNLSHVRAAFAAPPREAGDEESSSEDDHRGRYRERRADDEDDRIRAE
jgi:hypothetical protein